MSLEFIGHTSSRTGAETIEASGPIIDKAYIRHMAHTAEANGFDRLLIGSFATWPDNNQIAAYVLHNTERLGVMLAHRPGFVAPTVAARQLATLDQFSEGRLAVHVISGGTDEDQQRDGDFLAKDERYARTAEYLTVVKKVWHSDQPFDHQGDYYRVKGALSSVKPWHRAGVPIFFGGSSAAAFEVAGQHAEVYALWGESLAQTAETIANVRQAAARYGRENEIKFLLAFRPLVADTEDAAWARSRELLAAAKARYPAAPALHQNVGSQRLREAAAQGAVLDERLWTEFAAVTGAHGNSTALVGTPQQVADALLEYHRLGVDKFLIRGFDPVPDTLVFGRDVIPLVRAAVARRG
ncbi:alkanesulfonate monooxygenase [Pseudomonas sp. IT-P12]|uniref:LLM class flavin-dependent oxidoreductase n=1 Tax=unclassified Pseudomonas TaxID=196821 RepID=UPI001782F8DA|nr:LLM class flavin-dependent oxidoreductase [Pseudomonas sp. PDM04]MBD9438376.1 LLM class flavin-dependent oxidoreductase [Pseudomonas sp. PDM04]